MTKGLADTFDSSRASMATYMATITTHPPWLPWATLVATIFVSHNILTRRHISISLKIEEEQEEKAPPLSSPDPYPWEPNNNTSPSNTITLPSYSSPPQEKRHQPSNPSVEEQLQFLACMTFANGGLRSPTCPCCQ